LHKESRARSRRNQLLGNSLTSGQPEPGNPMAAACGKAPATSTRVSPGVGNKELPGHPGCFTCLKHKSHSPYFVTLQASPAGRLTPARCLWSLALGPWIAIKKSNKQPFSSGQIVFLYSFPAQQST